MADGVKDLIQAAWTPASPDFALRDYVTEDTLKALFEAGGRQVYVFPAGSRIVRPLARGAGGVTIKLYEHKVSIRGLEFYTGDGRPTKAWIDTRVKFFGQYVHDVLDLEDPASYLLGSLWTETIEVPVWADPDFLLGSKLWWAECEVAFYEKA